MKSKLVWGLGLFLAATVVWAQTISTSQIRGTITDESGAAVAGADVKLTQTATSAVRSATSATDGSYVFPALPVGSYQLEVTRQGFTKYLQTGIVLQVGVNPTIDVTLKVGAMTEQVTVEAQAAMVETQSTGVGQVIAPQQVQDLPLNGRQLTDLLTLTGGVSQGRSFRASYPSSATPSIAGGAQGSVAYWLDGGTHNDPLSNQNLPLPFPDTVEEFKVETSSLPAQYGTHPSGAVNVVTKSGTNMFHGDVFEYVRNFMFDSKNTRLRQPGRNPMSSMTLKRNQFGGTIGGPIQKDKLFFFLGWQDTIQRSTNPATPVALPTAAMLAGDFSQYPGAAIPPFAGRPSGHRTSAQPDQPRQLQPDHYGARDLSAGADESVRHIQLPETEQLHRKSGTGEDRLSREQPEHHLRTLLHHEFGAATGRAQSAGQPGRPSDRGHRWRVDRVQSLTLGDTYLIGTNMVNSFRATGKSKREPDGSKSRRSIWRILLAAVSLAGAQCLSIGPQSTPKFPKYMPDFKHSPGFMVCSPRFRASSPMTRSSFPTIWR